MPLDSFKLGYRTLKESGWKVAAELDAEVGILDFFELSDFLLYTFLIITVSFDLLGL